MGAGARTQQPGERKLVRVAREENSTGDEGRPTSHVSCKQTWRLVGASHCPVIRSRKACKSGGGRKTSQERGEDPLPT
jgi:hypothetical protein